MTKGREDEPFLIVPHRADDIAPFAGHRASAFKKCEMSAPRCTLQRIEVAPERAGIAMACPLSGNDAQARPAHAGGNGIGGLLAFAEGMDRDPGFPE